MPLRHVLYRCPLCGNDPTEGQGDEARCADCQATFVRAARGVLVRSSAGEANMSVAELVDRIRGHGGVVSAATTSDAALHYAADVLYHGAVSEEPLWDGGRLLGYVERPGRARRGVLELTDRDLSFRGAEGEEIVRWPLRDVTSLQVSTRSLQIGVRWVGTLQVTFLEASTFRWEELLQHVIREVWRGEGRGEIGEFQPRITGR